MAVPEDWAPDDEIGDDVVMHIGVPPTRVDVLDALETRVSR
jgi:hypothetical protein